jgi:hypothetical protein
MYWCVTSIKHSEAKMVVVKGKSSNRHTYFSCIMYRRT